jgi:hypothetical protein
VTSVSPCAPAVDVVIEVLLILPVVAVVFLVAALRWLSVSWREISDDELKETNEVDGSLSRLRGWLVPLPRRLTYRRDARGPFRRHRR